MAEKMSLTITSIPFIKGMYEKTFGVLHTLRQPWLNIPQSRIIQWSSQFFLSVEYLLWIRHPKTPDQFISLILVDKEGHELDSSAYTAYYAAALQWLLKKKIIFSAKEEILSLCPGKQKNPIKFIIYHYTIF